MLIGLPLPVQRSCIELLDIPTKLLVETTSRNLSTAVRHGSLWRSVRISSPKLTDQLLASLLQRMNCVAYTHELALPRCMAITGTGLDPLRDSQCLRIVDLCTDHRDPNRECLTDEDYGWQAGPNLDFKIVAALLNPMIDRLELVITCRNPVAPPKMYRYDNIYNPRCTSYAQIRAWQESENALIGNVWHHWEHPELVQLQQHLSDGVECPACLTNIQCSGDSCGCNKAGAPSLCTRVMIQCDYGAEWKGNKCTRWFCYEACANEEEEVLFHSVFDGQGDGNPTCAVCARTYDY